jgi:hypothetical protein
MSYTKGKWFHHAPSGSQHTAGGYISASEDRSKKAICHVYGSGFEVDEYKANAKRIVDCVNACDGMENPADEIAKLRYEIAMLYRLIDDKDAEIARMAIIAAKARKQSS